MITKTRAFGWTVIVTAGYNNPSGEGKIFFLNPATGVPFAAKPFMSTSFGTPGSPSGLTHIAGYTRDFRNQLTEQIYGGDLYGNLWRFDVSDPDPVNWVVKKFAHLTDDGGTPQPITTPPRIDVDVSNGIDRWVFVGTGKLLHVDDLDDLQAQRMYAFRDGTYQTPTPHADPLLLFTDLQAVSGTAGLGAGVVATKGWYDNLPAGQRIVKTPVTAVGLVGYISTGLPLDPCTVGQPVNIYARQFGNGESRLTDAGGNFIETIYEPTGGASIDVVATYDPGCTANCVPNIKLVVTSATNSQVLLFDAKLPDIIGQHRLSWRTLSQ
jgi:type IV pilus assembly protein PilY1